jgi:hypothetical protein
MLPGGLLLTASVLLVPGGLGFPAVLRYCLAGTNLHGGNAINNLSLRGWSEAQGFPYAVGPLAALAAGLAVVAVTARLFRGGRPPEPIWLGAVLMLGTFLAGAIAEVHFLLVAYASVLLLLATRPLPVRQAARFLPGLLLLALPDSVMTLAGAPRDGQTWLVAAEVLLFAALLATPPPGPAPVLSAAPALAPAVGPAVVP